MKIEIIHTNSFTAAQAFAREGFEPVECSFGIEGSVLGPLALDHHGAESHREGVALRAYRNHSGARREDPRFAGTGAGDADATFCIAALCGLLPHPSRAAELEKAPPPIKATGTRDLIELAAFVNQIDIDPIGIDKLAH